MIARAELLTGTDLVTSLWGAIGVVIVFAALIAVGLKFFVGAGRNVGQGVLAIVAIAVVAGIASDPQTVIDAGKAIGKLVGLG